MGHHMYFGAVIGFLKISFPHSIILTKQQKELTRIHFLRPRTQKATKIQISGGKKQDNQLIPNQKGNKKRSDFLLHPEKKEAKIGTSEAQKKFVLTIKTVRPDD